MLFLYIGVSLVVILLTIWIIEVKKKKRKKESQLGIFHHPSNFKKAPVEWVQKPSEDPSKEATTLQIDKSS